MGIRGDMECRYWKELGKAKSREIAEHFFECLNDPNFWTKLEDNEFTHDEVMAFLNVLREAKERFLIQGPLDE